MSHIKRKAMEKSWPLPRKGTKYLLKPYPGKKKEMSIPLGLIIRDVLKIANTRKEVKALLHNNEVKINGKIVTEEKFPLSIFDILSLEKLGKHFRVIFNKNGKIMMEEISEKEANLKICKVTGKKILKGGIQQINCLDGRNFIYKDKVKINDSIVVDLKENKIIKILPLKQGADVFIIGGKHIGEKGKISEIDEKIKTIIDGKSFEIQAKNIYVI
ncbi:MAG: hypothetical protein QW041_00705 [Candidatus Pacearchaeota archaeon]